MRTFAFAVLTTSLALAAAPASAHIGLSSPTPRHADQKSGPCGVGPNDMRGANITTYAPGAKIVVTWTEQVNHPGHFRISFDEDGFDGFVDPADYDDLYSNAAVLLDGIADKDGGEYMAEVTLPNIECDNCTLQVIQVMTDKPPYEIGTNDLYYQCADLKLEGEVMGTTGTPGTDTGDESTGDGPDATGAPDTSGGEDPTASGSTGLASTGGEQPTTGGGSETGGSSGAAGDVSDGGDSDPAPPDTGTSSSSTTGDESDDDKGCGCRSDGGAAGLLVLLPLLWRRRRG